MWTDPKSLFYSVLFTLTIDNCIYILFSCILTSPQNNATIFFYYICISFLQIPPHDGHPCCSAIHFPLPGHVQDFHLRERAHGAHTKKAATNVTAFSSCYFSFSICGITAMPVHFMDITVLKKCVLCVKHLLSMVMPCPCIPFMHNSNVPVMMRTL